MTQIFGKGADTWLRLALLAVGVATGASLLILSGITESQLTTRLDIAPDQPVPFSHKHHVSGLGIDCRYCHTSVEISESAGFPPTETCMTCHSQLWTEAGLLAPIRKSWRTRTPVHWKRVHNLPDYAYFDHSIHVQKGVGCTECHGQIGGMALTRQGNIMRMRFCIECHDDPAPRLRPRDEVFNTNWRPPTDRRRYGERLIEEYGIAVGNLTHCNVCHR